MHFTELFPLSIPSSYMTELHCISLICSSLLVMCHASQETLIINPPPPRRIKGESPANRLRCIDGGDALGDQYLACVELWQKQTVRLMGLVDKPITATASLSTDRNYLERYTEAAVDTEVGHAVLVPPSCLTRILMSGLLISREVSLLQVT